MMNAKVIVLANQKGGVAKTTTTKALGLGLAHSGKKVLMIDLDASGNLSYGMGIQNVNDYCGIADLLSQCMKGKKSDIEDLIVHLPVIDLLIGNQDLESLNVSLASYADGLFYLDEIIGSLRAQYEYILIDTMPVFGTLVRAAMIAADQIIIPIMPEYYSVEGMQRLLSEIASVRKRFNPKLELCGLLPTRVDIRLKNEHQRFLRQLYQTYHNECVIFEYIPNSTDLSQSSQGMDMYESAAKSEAVKAYQSLTDHILQEETK